MVTQTSMILTDVSNHYNGLIVQHRKLDREIKELYDTHQSDQIIKAAKLNKLHLKQQIEEIRSNLQSLIKS